MIDSLETSTRSEITRSEIEELELLKSCLNIVYKHSRSFTDVVRLKQLGNAFIEKSDEIRGRINGRKNKESNSNTV